MKRLIYTLVLLCAVHANLGAQDSLTQQIKLHFLYGSKPKYTHKNSEAKWFGGIHGGHVYIQVDCFFYSFYPYYQNKKFHIFSKEKDRCSRWVKETHKQWYTDTVQNKVSTYTVFVTAAKKDSLLKILKSYLENTPYDYSFFGNRCASAAYDALQQAGIVKSISTSKNIRKHFYPKLLRTRIFTYITEGQLRVECASGRSSRKWEKDTRRVRKKLQNNRLSALTSR